MSQGLLKVNINGKYQKADDPCQPVGLSLVDRLLVGISPWRCVLCSDPAAGMDICRSCLVDLPWLRHACRGCGIPLPDSGLRFCGGCLGSHSAPDSYVIALAYEYPVAQMLAALKFRRELTYARVLGELLSIRLQKALLTEATPLPDLLLPVPLHPMRQLQRTFNQAELIAGHVARVIHLPVKRHILRRVRNTPAQMTLSRKARLRNLRGSFAVSGDLHGVKIALLDDVVTTCATAREIIRVLKAAGAAEVQVWAVARTV
jgi:ComF family protein